MSTTCTVSFTARGPNGVILPNARLIFVPVGPDLRGVGVWVVARERVEATADSGGVGSVALVGGSWTVTMISSLGQMTAPFDCPASGVANLESLIGQSLPAAFNAIQLSVLAAGGRGLFETPAAGRAATVNGEVFLAPLSPNGVGIYRRDSASVSPQIGTFFTGEVTTSSSDTTVGRLLKVGDFGIGAVSQVNYLQDIDALNIPSGLWPTDGVTGGTTFGTFPVGAPTRYGYLLVNRVGSQNQQQLWQPLTTERLWVRRLSGGVWQPWREIFTAGSILGAVSQSGGVPTGRLFERGSNANGEFLRLPDGTQECWRTLTAATGAGVAWTFPAAFSVAPVVGGNAVATVQSNVTLDAAPSTTAVTLSARGTNDARRADVMHLRAIGRWF